MVLLLFEQIVQLFLCVILGWFLVQLRLLKPTDSRVLSVVCLYLIIPCVIITAFQIERTPELLHGLALSLGTAIGIHVLFFIATALIGAVGTFLMGLLAKLPVAIAPGMGLNAFFVYTVCFALGFTWQQALSMVFICGLLNIILRVIPKVGLSRNLIFQPVSMLISFKKFGITFPPF